MQRETKSIIFIGSVVAVLIMFLGLYLLLSTVKPQVTPDKTPPSFSSPTALPTIPKPANIQKIPTLALEQGSGVNTEAESVQTSIAEIEKLSAYLPYKKDYTLSTGIPISVVIPSRELLNNPWTLSVQVFGINYHTSPSDTDYVVMKRSFLEAVSDTNSWLLSHDANPAKIYISWGDNPIINKQANGWLQKQ